MIDLADLSATALNAAYRAGEVSPVEVARDILERIASVDPGIGAFAHVDAGTTLEMARASEARWCARQPIGPGDGIPTTVKDLMDVRGWPTRRGSLATADDPPAGADSPCVARLREAGAVFLGKTTVPEFGWKGVNDSPLSGPTRNPWDRRLTSGGSSGGAAAAAALGLGVWHTASDAAGSIRIPAAFCGVFGFKPTHGLVPLFPPSAFSGLGHHGPIARSVADAAAMLAIMASPDARDATAVPLAASDLAGGIGAGVEAMRIGVATRFAGIEVDPEIGEHVGKAARELGSLGAHIEEAALDLAGARETIEILWNVGCATILETIAAAHHDRIDPGLLAAATRGSRIAATTYRAALIEREHIASRLAVLCAHHDLLILPVAPVLPFAHGSDVPSGSGMPVWLDWSPFTYPFNLSHQPAASVPCGLSRAGLPVAVQIVGRRFGDAAVLRAADAFEGAAGRLACPALVG